MAIAGLCWLAWYLMRRLTRRGAEDGMSGGAQRMDAPGVAGREIRGGGAPLVIRGGPSSPDVADELKKLADLRDRGVLTEAEFETQKAKLLASG